MKYDGCSCVDRGASTCPLCIHWVSGIASADGRYHDVPGLTFLSFKHSLARALGWKTGGESVLLRTLLAPSATIPNDGPSDSLGEVSREWSRVTSLLANISAESVLCVRFSGVGKRALYGALFDPRLASTYKGVEMVSHRSCASCREDLSRCWANTSSGEVRTLEDVFFESIIRPVSMLLARGQAMIVDVEDISKKSRSERIGAPIV